MGLADGIAWERENWYPRMETMNTELLNFIAGRIKREARQKHEDFGYSGAMSGDDGSGMLRHLETYEQGFNRMIPTEWQEYVKEFKNSQDPDYARYLELKKKFGG